MAAPNAYLLSAPLNHRGHCECGWSGRRRFMRGSAVLDVLDHCGQSGHLPTSVPWHTTSGRRVKR